MHPLLLLWAGFSEGNGLGQRVPVLLAVQEVCPGKSSGRREQVALILSINRVLPPKVGARGSPPVCILPSRNPCFVCLLCCFLLLICVDGFHLLLLGFGWFSH